MRLEEAREIDLHEHIRGGKKKKQIYLATLEIIKKGYQ